MYADILAYRCKPNGNLLMNSADKSSTKKPPLIWLNIFVFSFSMLLAVVAAPIYGYFFGYGMEHWIWLAICFTFCNLSITTGYHRLWSHKAFEAHSSLRFLFALGGAFALKIAHCIGLLITVCTTNMSTITTKTLIQPSAVLVLTHRLDDS